MLSFQKIFSKITKSMRFGTMTGHPTGRDNRYNIEGGAPPSLSTHYHGPVTILFHSLTSVHIHQQSDDATPFKHITIDFDLTTTNTYKIPGKPVSGSSNSGLLESAAKPPLDPNVSPSSATMLEGAAKDCTQLGGEED
jgi:hypothetical protein